MTFKFGLIFLILFTSRWFKTYSINLAGERREEIGTKIEHHMSILSEFPTFNRVLNSTTNFWFLTEYLACFPASLKFPVFLGKFVMPFVIVNGLIHLIELRLACARIIDLDVEERLWKYEEQ